MSECCTCRRDEISAGDFVHSKAMFEGVRIGCAERHVVRYISDFCAVVEIQRGDGSIIIERIYTRKDFDSKYERCH
jgi:hypothetical protein